MARSRTTKKDLQLGKKVGEAIRDGDREKAIRLLSEAGLLDELPEELHDTYLAMIFTESSILRA